VRTSSLTALFLTGVILAAAGNAAAAGLGKLSILSSLGERLTADVELVSVTPAQASSLKARVAPPQAYAHSNVPYSMALSGLHVKVEKHANGQPYLRITSTQPYNEPYLDVLLQLSWDGGEITREYTALVNPAGYHMPPAVAATAPRSSTRTATAAAPAPQTRPAPRARPAPAAAPAPAPGSYEVKRGDTLYGIAEATMPTEVTVDQMLIGLYRANPHAFHGNINRMTAGKILRIPSTQQIEQVPASKARREVKLQIANWHAYRNRIAAAASRKSAAAAPEAGGAVSGKISTKVEEAHPKGMTAPKDVVRLSKGEAPGAGKGESTTARVEALEEEASARQKALDEANSRIAQLEKTISDMRKLMAIKSAGMASAQQQAQAASAPAAGAAAQSAASAGSSPSVSAPAATTSSSAPAAAAAGATAAAGSTTGPEAAAAPSGSAASNATTESKPAAASQPAAPAGATAAGPAAAAAAAAKPETATAAAAKEPAHGAAGATPSGQSAEKPATGKAEAKPAVKKAATAAHAAPRHHVIPKPAPQPGFLQMLTENPLYIGAAVIIILLLIYLWMRRRRGPADDGEPGLQAAPLLAGGAAAATTAAALATVKDSPVAAPQPAPEPQPQPAAAPAGAISDDVDPLAEAEVYIAYGRDEQAEEILKDALVYHPERTDVQVKLLEVYAARKDTAAFETLAQKLHQSVASDSEEWLKVAALGYTLAPANPLFEAGKAAPSAASPASAPDGLDFELDVPSAQTTTDIPLDPAPEDDSVSKTGRLSAQFAAAGLELTASGALAPDFMLPGGTPGPEDTQRIAEGEKSAADEPAPIPDFTLGRDSNAATGLDFGDADAHGTAHTDGGAGKVLNLEDSQLLMDEALKAARAEPLMPDFQLDLPAQSGSATTDIGHDGGDHAKVPDLALDGGTSGAQPMDLTLEPHAAAPGSGKGSAPSFDLSGINLDFDEEKPFAATPASGEKDGHWHDVQTKFDLAKAYQEMGDNDGAKEILREVVEEGDAEQQTQAKALLRNLD
jgi:pilus assembly protein FimV